MNYENQIYKISDNLYKFNWFNFLKIEYDITLSSDTNFTTSHKRIKFKYIDYDDFDKYNFKDLIYDETVDKYKIRKEKKNIFPYTLLNIDYANELLYKNENNEWFLLKRNSYDTNSSVRCQQGEYKEYKIELSNNDTYELVIKRNLLEAFKYENIYDDNYKYLKYLKQNTTVEKIESGKDYNDQILNILFSNKFPLYFYPSYDYVAINNITLILYYIIFYTFV